MLSEYVVAGRKDHELVTRFFDGLHRMPEVTLALAIIENGLIDLIDNIVATSKHRQNLFAAAREWIFGPPSKNWIFDFENCCELVGLDPNYLRDLCRKKINSIRQA